MSSLLLQNAYLTAMLKQAGLDAEARDVAQRIQSVLTDEIHHRMKNMLTMVTAIVRQSMRSATNLVDAEKAISTRLIAMAKAHDMLLKADLKSADLASVIAGAVAQHNSALGAIDIMGDAMQVRASADHPQLRFPPAGGSDTAPARRLRPIVLSCFWRRIQPDRPVGQIAARRLGGEQFRVISYRAHWSACPCNAFRQHLN